MKKIACFITICVTISVAIAQKKVSFPQKDKDAVRAVLQQQQQAWNEGDIESFMQSYWHSDSLAFIGKKGVTKGWQSTFDNYKKAYPDKATMGQLQFDIVSVESFSAATVFVIGKWNLKREESKGDLGGYFTLVFKKINKQWVIVSDHTS
jgi:uncharacterized protein (TIGR02246 family)